MSACFNRVKSFIRNLSAPAEFCLVLFICFGLGIGYQTWAIINRHLVLLNNRHLLVTVIMELFYLALIFWIGRIRGWSLAAFGWQVSWKWTGAGILLFLAVTAAQIFVIVVANVIHPEESGFTVIGLTVPVIFVVSVINPFFEEALESGYIIHSLQRFGLWPAVLASGAFRGLLHLYQGFNGALSIFVLGVVFGLVYWRWRQLWPLIVAHFLCDFIGLLYLTHRAG